MHRFKHICPLWLTVGLCCCLCTLLIVAALTLIPTLLSLAPLAVVTRLLNLLIPISALLLCLLVLVFFRLALLQRRERG